MAKKLCMGCMSYYEDYDSVCPYCGYIDGSKPEEPHHLTPGTVIGGKYIVGRAVGYGGFSVVYIGYDYSIEKIVAIKEYIPSDYSTRTPGVAAVSIFSGDRAQQFQGGVTKFVDEAKRLARFRGCDGIVDVYDVIEDNNTAYIIMEYLDGESMEEFLKREHKIEPYAAVQMMLPLIRTLGMLHQQKIIHRDIAPDNIKFTSFGTVKLIDFGAARQATSTSHSKSLSVVVKPGYTPPEQYRSRGEQGPHTDVYSCGATLYEMITGHRPDDSMERDARETIKEPSYYCPDIPANVETAIMNALNLEIGERTPDMEQFEYELTTDEVVARIKPKKKKFDFGRWPIWLKITIPAVLTALIALGVLLWTGVIDWHMIFLSTNAKERAPRVLNMSVDEAKEKTEAYGLDFVIVGKNESDDIPKDLVLSQSLEAGTPIDGNSVLEITISSGKGYDYMPDLIGMSEEAARETLEEIGMKIKVNTAQSDIAPGYVCRQEVKEGQSVAKGDKVDKGTEIILTVSTGNGYEGRTSTKVPDFVDESWNEAITTAAKGRVYVYKLDPVTDNYTVDEDVITGQNPEAGKNVKEGTGVGLVITLENKTTHVPDVVYKTLGEAEKMLEYYNLTYTIEQQYSDDVAEGVVISQNLPEGKEVDKKAEIALVVSLGRKAVPTTTETVTETTTETTTETETETEASTERKTEARTEKRTEATTAAPTTTEDTKTIVPSLSGMSVNNAKTALKEAELTVGEIVYYHNDSATDGSVIGQSKAAGKEIEKGSSVSIYVCNNETRVRYRYRDSEDDPWSEWKDGNPPDIHYEEEPEEVYVYPEM